MSGNTYYNKMSGYRAGKEKGSIIQRLRAWFSGGKTANPPTKVLFICTANRCRSPTAAWLYQENPGLEVDSAGLADTSSNKVRPELMAWAQRIVVFEERQRRELQAEFGDQAGAKIVCLDIADDYEPHDPSLIRRLARELTPVLGRPQRLRHA